MKTLYKYVEFNETFLFPASPVGYEYVKKNHNRGQLKQKGRVCFKRFAKNTPVELNIEETPLNQFMKVE